MLMQRVVGFVCLIAVAGCGVEMPTEADAEPAAIDSKKVLRADRPVSNRWIVALDDEQPEIRALRGADFDAFSREMATREPGAALGLVFRSSLRGFSATLTEEQALALAQDPRVRYVEEVGEIELTATQSSPTWGLDRVDQASLPLSNSYTYANTGAGVNAYVVDTGIRRTHAEFGGRAVTGFDAIGDGQNGNDCNGHGTHVAGTIGAATWGVAKGAKLYAVRVLDCQGSGTNEGVIAGVEWVAANHVKPAVANMSLGGGASQALDDAVRASISAGVTFVLAAGNENANACNGSPSRVQEAITVGSTSSSDARSSFSNFGTCVDLFAPGSSIKSTWGTSDTATNTIDGTSMASPHVAGAAALYLAANPAASPQAVRDALANNATPGKVTNPGTGSPNRLLYTGFIGGGGGPANQPPQSQITAPASGATVSGTVTVTAAASDADGTITKVSFTLPGGGTVDDTTAPYSASWNTVAAGNGSRTLTATATDDDGATTSASITVNVSNGGGGSACIDGEYAATGLPMAIPDNNATGVTSTLPVVGNGTVASLSISLNATHTYRGDLKVTLVAPDGTQVVVHNRTGGSADNLVLSAVPVTGFAGRPAAGTWKLLAQDLAAADTGSVTSWSLRITATCSGSGTTGWTASGSPNLATVDNGSVCTTVTVTGTGNAADAKIELAGTHSWRSILRGTLAHGGVTRDGFPVGTFASNAGSFSLQAQPVAGFSGDAAGAWTLCLFDTDAYGDAGTFATWSVHN